MVMRFKVWSFKLMPWDAVLFQSPTEEEFFIIVWDKYQPKTMSSLGKLLICSSNCGLKSQKHLGTQLVDHTSPLN
jgi:hypothetical protein